MVIRSFGGDHGDAIVQVLRRDGGCQERFRARSPALSLSILWLQLHEYATQGQAGGDEGDGRAALRDGHMSFGMIGRILGVSDVSVLRWVRAEAEALPEPAVPADVKVLILDEMWHFVKKRQVGSTGRRNVVGSELFQEVHDGAHGSSRLVGRAEAGAMDPVEGWTIAQ